MTEQSIHRQICAWLQLQYPDVVFHTDSSGVTIPNSAIRGMNAKAIAAIRGIFGKWINELHSNDKIPDLFIAEPRGSFAGCYVELKVSRDKAFKKNGELRQTAHIQEQWATCQKLKQKGYFVIFAPDGFEGAQKAIRAYLNQ